MTAMHKLEMKKTLAAWQKMHASFLHRARIHGIGAVLSAHYGMESSVLAFLDSETFMDRHANRILSNAVDKKRQGGD